MAHALSQLLVAAVAGDGSERHDTPWRPLAPLHHSLLSPSPSSLFPERSSSSPLVATATTMPPPTH